MHTLTSKGDSCDIREGIRRNRWTGHRMATSERKNRNRGGGTWQPPGRPGLALYRIYGARWLWESICDVPSSSLGTEQGNSGELRMGDGGWSCLEPSRMDAFFSGTYRHQRKFDPNSPESQLCPKYSVYYFNPSILTFDPGGYEGFTYERHRAPPRPYTSPHRSSNARIIRSETCPKNLAEMAAWRGFANANAMSYLTRVDPLRPVAFVAGSNPQVVSRVLNSGVEEDATALPEERGVNTGVGCSKRAKTHFY